MELTLIEREARLASLLKVPPPSVLYVNHFDNEAHDINTIVRDAVVPFELEGLVAKRKESVYRPGVRTADWVKVKRKNATPAQRSGADRRATTSRLACKAATRKPACS
jgi:bifunctional non-homologous end joining protein LigD